MIKMSYVVIAQSPGVDVSQVAGPYRGQLKALDISEELTARGYNTEVVKLVSLADIDQSPPWDGLDDGRDG